MINLNSREKFMINILLYSIIIFLYNLFIHYPNLDKIEALSMVKNDIDNIKFEEDTSIEEDILDKYIKLEQDDILSFIQKHTVKGAELIAINFINANLNENIINLQIELEGNKKFISKSILNIEKGINSIYITDLNTQEYKDKTIATIGFSIHNN